MSRSRAVALAFGWTLVFGSRLFGQHAGGTPAPGVRLSGYLQARQTWQRHAGYTATLNRARLTASGAVGSGFTWRIQGEFRTGNAGTGRPSVSLQDAFIRWERAGLGIQAGQFKTPFSREFLTSLPDVESADRSTVADSLAPRRDIGLMADHAFGRSGTLAMGIFNGEGQNVTANRDSTVLGVVRATVRPIPSIGLGAHAARYFGDSTRYGADLSYEGRRLTVRAEYAAQARDSLGGEHDRGWFLLGAVKPARASQLFAKYEWFERPAVSAQQKNRAWTAGLHLWAAGTAVRLTVEYVSRKVGDPGRRVGVVLTQLQARF
ncbi:MAG TPA: porin [Gemmatimonadales bacterium]|jgi:phosphate-selective porin|nr:porin [Gemmatimonadales bacterium]